MTATRSQIRDALKWFQSNVSACDCEVCKPSMDSFKVIESILQSALDTQKPAVFYCENGKNLDGLKQDAQRALDEMPESVAGWSASVNRGFMSHRETIRAALTGDCGGGDFSRLKSQAYIHLYTALEYSNPETIKQRIRWAIESMNGIPLTADND